MIDNSNLPQRLYYSLPDAAKELGCEVRDLIHYAAIQALQLSIYIPFHHGSPDAWFHLNMPSSKVADIDMFSMLSVKSEFFSFSMSHLLSYPILAKGTSTCRICPSLSIYYFTNSLTFALLPTRSLK